MHVPAWLLRILISYLTGRSMYMRYNGATSSLRSLPGSSPQGVFLGCFFFMIKFNGALLRPNVPRPFTCPVPVMSSSATECTVKYIDDASKACSIQLKKSLIPYPASCTGYILDPINNQLQDSLTELKDFTDKNLMVINEKKSQIMSFNFSKTLTFPPEFTIGNSPILEVVTHTKLLGIVISVDLKWNLHVEYMCKKAAKKIWMLRRLKSLNMEPKIILDFYLKEIRSVLEFGVACWNGGLTAQHSEQIERIQKIAVNIILCDSDWQIPYEVGCTSLGIDLLVHRRTELCIRFIQKTALNPMHSDWFCPSQDNHYTRQDLPPYREFKCNSKRFYNSPLCHLTRMLNQNPVKT